MTMQIALGSRILHCPWMDIGCGSGGIASELARHVESMVGIDHETWPVLSYWQLKSLFSDNGLEVQSLILERLMTDSQRFSGFFGNRTARSLIGLFEPFAPGFVFLLFKKTG